MKTYKIAVFGCGFVGGTVADFLEQGGVEVTRVDPKLYPNTNPTEAIMNTDGIVICVPTPSKENGSCDDKHIREVLELCDYRTKVLLKSTVTPDLLSSYTPNVVYNPEFLRESTTPNEDFENQDTIVIGTSSINDYEIVKRMYEEVALDSAEYFHTSPSEAEMIKCSQNTMLASRVAIANIIYDACIENDVNYDKVKKIAFDRFEILGPHMTLVPGPDGSRGFGGKCLPKDIRAFSTIHDSKLLNSLIGWLLQ